MCRGHTGSISLRPGGETHWVQLVYHKPAQCDTRLRAEYQVILRSCHDLYRCTTATRGMVDLLSVVLVMGGYSHHSYIYLSTSSGEILLFITSMVTIIMMDIKSSIFRGQTRRR